MEVAAVQMMFRWCSIFALLYAAMISLHANNPITMLKEQVTQHDEEFEWQWAGENWIGRMRFYNKDGTILTLLD